MATLSTTALVRIVSGSGALVLAAIVTGTSSVWLGWAIVTVMVSGWALLHENWGREPPSDSP
ncbi:hypothetical protein [Halovivax asiaticus]|nr:hypothetical protein [Halovivax asiaticus]